MAKMSTSPNQPAHLSHPLLVTAKDQAIAQKLRFVFLWIDLSLEGPVMFAPQGPMFF